MAEPDAFHNRLTIEDACDRFEEFWRAGMPVRIEDFLSGQQIGDPQTEIELLWELVIIDMEHRWRTKGRPEMNGPFVSDYAIRFGQLEKQPVVLDDLLLNEYRIRQRWGDQPTYGDYREKFSVWSKQRIQQLREIAISQTNPILTVIHRQVPVLTTRIERPVLIGRQLPNEPPPFRVLIGSEIDRIIIAPSSDRSVSRDSAFIDIVAKSKFIATNKSKKHRIVIDTMHTLLPNDQKTVNKVFSLAIGQSLIRVASTEEEAA